MFAVDAGSTQGVGEMMKQFELAKKGVHAGGYDLLPRTLQLIQDGHLDFTIDQQPYLQGFYTVMQMFTFLGSGGLIGPADTNTGPQIRHQGQRAALSRHQDALRRQVDQAADRPQAHPARSARLRPHAPVRGVSVGFLRCARGEHHPRRGGCSSSTSRSANPDFLYRRQPAEPVAVHRAVDDHRVRRDHAADLRRDRSLGRAGVRARAVHHALRATTPACRWSLALLLGLRGERWSGWSTASSRSAAACRPSSRRSGCST